MRYLFTTLLVFDDDLQRTVFKSLPGGAVFLGVRRATRSDVESPEVLTHDVILVEGAAVNQYDHEGWRFDLIEWREGAVCLSANAEFLSMFNLKRGRCVRHKKPESTSGE